MKAIMVNTLYTGGAERIVLNIATYLKKENKDIIIIVLNKIAQEYEIKDTKIKYLVHYKDLKRGVSWKKLFIYPCILIKLMRYLKKEDIELVQSHLFTASILNVIARVLGGKHKVQIVNHSLVSYEKNGGLVGCLKLRLLRFVYKRADLIISISKMMKADIERQILNKINIKHIVISNPHNIQAIIKKFDEPIENFCFEKGKKYFIAAGTLDSRKRFDLLIESFSVIQTHFSDIELVILGGGQQLEKLKYIANYLDCASKVHFLGYVKNPFKYIVKSNVFFLTSETEGLPNSLIEAMICKVPVISSDCPTGPREIIAPSTDCTFQLKEGIEVCEYGILFPVGEKKYLIEAINGMIKNEENFKIKACKAFDYVQKYDHTKILNKYKEVIFDN